MPSLLEQLREAAARRDTPAADNTPTAPQAAPQAVPSSAPPASSPAPSSPCSCGFRTFWLDSYGNWTCQACRPPKLAFMARRTITLGSAGEATEITSADEARYDRFIEVVGADGRVHIVHRDCLDPRSDYFDISVVKKISLGVEAAEREFFQTNKYLSELMSQDGKFPDRLPGPWPRNEAKENFSLQPDENANLPKKNKNSRGGARGGRKR